MKVLRFIGDVHQSYDEYLPLLKDVDYSFQVGDLGFDYTYLTRVDTTRHRAIAGNHDNYSENDPNYFKNQPIFLGDYGVHEVPGAPPIFYARGAWSIDHLDRQRRQGWPHNMRGTVTWWDTEELSYDDFEKAIALYGVMKPEIVVTHECPMDIVQYVTNPTFCEQFGYPAGTIKTRTNQALQKMFETHQPRMWLFGHYHVRWEGKIGGTVFKCLDMLRRETYIGPVDPAGSLFDLPL